MRVHVYVRVVVRVRLFGGGVACAGVCLRAYVPQHYLHSFDVPYVPSHMCEPYVQHHMCNPICAGT